MLEFDKVSYRYDASSVNALDGFSLNLERGSVMALLGPNGSGKSTALGIGASWLKPHKGTFTADGMIAFLPQVERLAFSFTCLEYLGFGRAPHLPYLAVPTQREDAMALDALVRLGMDYVAHRRITSLSGGELQLVRIARTLVQDAPWLLLDEPSDCLDPAHAAKVGATIRSLALDGKGILFSTHDIAFARAHADKAALIKDGKISAHGPAQEILTEGHLAELYGHPFRTVPVPVPFF